ncbi:murein transglycosylase [Cladophialophora yegresii CBS 114405]|uniref:Murein transglycosylase n=1 Tax=Cladophialophora yegresii CBS 114405 TaxID=1182544 RepID=W9VEJ8_9EURO|nr:murein transglycosylase [Cladophialophora yegresii CBS 114405]EXJ54047.1 murein transglycosylase [Cladophialophora yegresii CBS 114405]
MGFDGTSVTDQVKTLIEKYHVGSILLKAQNLKSAEQATQLILDLQTLARQAGHPVPLLIALDQENGGVNSLYDEVYIRQFPSAMGLAATGSKKLAKDIARATAQELNSCGINWILGPVLDVLTNARNQPLGVRSVGDDPQEVSAYGVECIKGYHEGGVATCGKHFPSYGNLEFFGVPDDVPTITDSLENLSQTALIPFRAAIAHGIDSMMVGGVAMASSQVNVMHACLSEQIVRDLLRHELRFDGVVVSECLEMEALSRNIGISGGTVMAFKAGCDLILTCRTLSVQEDAINGLTAGLDNGMIERFRVQESVQRILNMKAKYTSWEKAFSPSGIDNLARLQPLHTSLSTTAYNKSITVVRDQNHYLPLSRVINADEELLLLTPLVKPLPASALFHFLQNEATTVPHLGRSPSIDTNTSIMSGEQVFKELGRMLARYRNGKISHTSYTANGVRPLHENLLNRARGVVVVTADAGRNMYQNAFAKHISMLCKLSVGPDGTTREKPCVVVAVSSPFDFASDTSIGTYVCTYDFTESALQALVQVLYGELAPAGVLPGSFSQRPQTSHTRQQWLVESFSEDRDSTALDGLLLQSQDEPSVHAASLRNATSSTFLLRDPDVEEAHFVVRNSSTKELFGFCTTYYFKNSGVGHIGAIIVDPARRRLSIGHSLHDRAVRALLQKKGITKFQLGVRFPHVYLGIPKLDPLEYKRQRQWFAKLGWNVSLSTPVATMMIRDLSMWSAPEGLGQALSLSEVKYDLVHGAEYTDAMMEHLTRCAQTDVRGIHQRALGDKAGCGIIRAKRASDQAILASILMCRPGSMIARFIPSVSKQVGAACLSSPVISTMYSDRVTLFQGLVLLGIRQLKKQGVRTVLLDYTREDFTIHSLKALGFTITNSFEEISSDPVHWTMMSAT